jgi:methionine-rich copper-binding protein CopC
MTMSTVDTSRRRFAGVALAALMLGASLVVSSATTSAAAESRRHTKLEKGSPGVNDTITAAPVTLGLWFNEKVDLKTIQIRLQKEGGPIATLGTAGRDSVKSDKSVVYPIMSDLDAGTYRVTWAVAGADGHPVQGRYAFVLK